MNTPKGRTWFRVGESRAEAPWAQTCAGVGAVAWTTAAMLARAGKAPIGAIELVFLFAPLVIVPLGMELLRVTSSAGRTAVIGRRLQPMGAGLAALALWLPPGRLAGVVACGWMMVCALMAVSGLLELISSPKLSTSFNSREKWSTRFGADPIPSTSRFALAVAQIDLAVGGAWFVASRLGLRPMGIQEPICLLTAVHFHFAGFATALIAAAALHFSGARTRRSLAWIVSFVVGMPFVVAVGFVISPAVKAIAAVLFSVSVAALAICVRSCAKQAHNKTARRLLELASTAVFAGMVLACIYAIADFLKSDVLLIPQMARTHGLLNAVAFCMCGLLGWLIEFSSTPE